MALKIVSQREPLPTGPRVAIALDAAWELETLAIGMLEAMLDCDMQDRRYRTQAVRAKELASVMMGALGDEGERVSELRARLTGLPVAQCEVQHG